MSKSTINLTRALQQIPSRFEIIDIAAERARQIQNYETELKETESKIRNTSTLMIAQTKVKGGKVTRENKLEQRLEQLLENPIKLFVDNSENDKPTVVALREIQEGLITREYLLREKSIASIRKTKEAFDAVESLIFEDIIDEEELIESLDMVIK